MSHFGGIDLGGTKIEARLFDSNFRELDRRRIETPVTHYEEMLKALVEQARWLDVASPGLVIGLGVPGVINPRTGQMLTANLPATGYRLEADLVERFGRRIPCINDCRAFVLSEARLGAGRGYNSVLGLVIGTGVAGGHVINGAVIPDFNNQHGEYGHMPMPAGAVARHGLPLLDCGCGKIGCFETVIAGPGLKALALRETGQQMETKDIIAAPECAGVMEIWTDLIAELISLLVRATDPHVIVLGGGLGMIDGLPDRLMKRVPPKLLDNTEPPIVAQAEGGDASGARGAALFAQMGAVVQ